MKTKICDTHTAISTHFVMDNEWDLHAVVRGCAATLTDPDPFHEFIANNPPPPTTAPANVMPSLQMNIQGGLHEIYKDFDDDPPPPPDAMPIPGAHAFQQMNMQRFLPSIPPRRRKNLEMKFVGLLTQEELSDSWAWRKYGQKHVKGNPNPRNYYRCSTFKGCAAQKQVERSPDYEGIFVVSYLGEHTHARPTQRSSLAVRNNNVLLLQRGSVYLSPPPSASSLSPATQSMEDGPSATGDDVIDNIINIIRGFQD